MEKAIDHKPKTINCKGKLINLDKPLVMGILNLTPDSFFDGGQYSGETDVLERVESMLNDGADIIDIGGQSTRPGAKMVSQEDEKKRVLPLLKSIVNEFPEAIISIDTFYGEIARASIGEGASIINDISAGSIDENMMPAVAEMKVPYVLMHMVGTPSNMQGSPQYNDVTSEVFKFFSKHINRLHEIGVKDIIIDPGIGFGKTVDHNLELIANLDMFQALEKPILIGLSRKSFTNKILNTSNKDQINSTVVLNTLALDRGANIIRVHVIKEAVEASKIVSFIHSASKA